MIPLQKVKDIIEKYNNLEKELSAGTIDSKSFAKKSKEYSNLGNIIEVAKEYVSFQNEEKDLEFFSRASNEFQLVVKLIETRKNMPYIDGSEGDESDVYLKQMVRKK